MSQQPAAATAIWERFPARERLAVNYTLTCNLACAHCNTESSPQRRERLTPEQVEHALVAGAGSGKRHLTLSGGEVFLFPAETLRIVARATELGYTVDLETNAFWARTEEMALEKLRPFVDAGLAGMSLSADAYHTRYFPVTRSINAARAGRSLGLLIEMNFCPSDDEEEDRAILQALREAGEPYLVNELVDRGRGRDLLTIGRGRRVDDLPDCDSLTTTIHATGDVYACCEVEDTNTGMKRTPVYLGSCGDDPGRLLGGTSQGTSQERLVEAYYTPGSPAYFRRLVREHPAFQPLGDERFLSICDFCVRSLSDPRRAEVVRALVEGEDTP